MFDEWGLIQELEDTCPLAEAGWYRKRFIHKKRWRLVAWCLKFVSLIRF